MNALAHGLPEDIPSGVTSAVWGNTRFALDLHRTLQTTPGKLSFSPYSVSVALAMTSAGARGETAAQMARTMHLGPYQGLPHLALAALEARLAYIRQRGDVRLHVANRLWPQEGYKLLKAFWALVQQCYGAPVTPVDYRIGDVGFRERRSAGSQGGLHGDTKGTLSVPHG